jgi:hypothetical protein
MSSIASSIASLASLLPPTLLAPPAHLAHLSLLEQLEPSVAVRVFSFLEPRDAARAARCSSAARELAMEELVWRQFALRVAGAPLAAGYSPPDESWVAECRFRRALVAREKAFQRALVMGMAGGRKANPPLEREGLAPARRFATFESAGGPAERRRAQRRAAAAAAAADASAARPKLPPGALSTHAKIDAASLRFGSLRVGAGDGGEGGGGAGGDSTHGSRQGTATWSSLGGIAFS